MYITLFFFFCNPFFKKNCIFFSSNCWDIHGASNFGFQTVWVNRKKNINELLPGQVDDEVQSLKDYFFKV